jgi:methylated-DNA-[protein]-cysteine S-methyltransferase
MNKDKEITKWLKDYYQGKKPKNFVPKNIHGTAFQKKVWTALTKIPYGKTATYGEIAKKVGSPKAFRAVGGACNKNPYAIVIPCHRVIGSNGDLTGFAGGLKMKKKLLDLEQH